nr:MAG TPA: hypothetical protein [Bacteriophage sp.]
MIKSNRAKIVGVLLRKAPAERRVLFCSRCAGSKALKLINIFRIY